MNANTEIMGLDFVLGRLAFVVLVIGGNRTGNDSGLNVTAVEKRSE